MDKEIPGAQGEGSKALVDNSGETINAMRSTHSGRVQIFVRDSGVVRVGPTEKPLPT